MNDALYGLQEPVNGQRTPAQIVRDHQLELFARSFPRWITGYMVLACLIGPATVGLMIWVIVSFALQHSSPCDVPLRMWCIVMFASSAMGVLHALVLRCICQHDTRTPVPWHAKLYMVVVSLFEFAWIIVGICLVAVSRTCEDTAPKLFTSVKFYVAINCPFDVILGVNEVGLYSILSWMLRNGLLNTGEAAPSDTLGRLRAVPFSADGEEFRETPECSICMVAFDGELEAKCTPCGHLFHARCLGNWLKMSRTCPLCRSDIVRSLGQAPRSASDRVIGRMIGLPQPAAT